MDPISTVASAGFGSSQVAKKDLDREARPVKEKRPNKDKTKNVRPLASRDVNVPLPCPADLPCPFAGRVSDALAPGLAHRPPPPRPPKRWADDPVNASDDEFEQWLDSIAPTKPAQIHESASTETESKIFDGDDRELPFALFFREASRTEGKQEKVEDEVAEELPEEDEDDNASTSESETDSTILEGDDRELPSALFFREASRTDKHQDEVEEEENEEETSSSKPRTKRLPLNARQPLDGWLAIVRRTAAYRSIGRYLSKPHGPAELAVQTLLTLIDLDLQHPSDKALKALDRLVASLQKFTDAAAAERWKTYEGSKCQAELCSGLDGYDTFYKLMRSAADSYLTLLSHHAQLARFKEMGKHDVIDEMKLLVGDDKLDASIACNEVRLFSLEHAKRELHRKEMPQESSDIDSGEDFDHPRDALAQALHHMAHKD